MRCGLDDRRILDFDHIVPVAHGGSNDASNGQLLCCNCHRIKSIEQGTDSGRPGMPTTRTCEAVTTQDEKDVEASDALVRPRAEEVEHADHRNPTKLPQTPRLHL